GTKLIALIDHHPEGVTFRLKRQAIGIAQAGSIKAMCAGGSVDLPDRGAPALGLYAVFGDVAVGADTRIELGAVRARRQALGPVMVDRAAGQFGEQGAGRGD